MEKKSHHYVPQFLLKNFSENKKSIGMFINSNSKFIKQASIKKQACKDYLYGKNKEIEDMLMIIETHASSLIRSIIQSITLPKLYSEEYNLLMLFILLSEARVQKQADTNEKLITELMRVSAKMYKEHGRLDVPDEAIDNLQVTYDVPNLYSMKAAVELYPILLDLKTVILIIDNDRYFITSDRPIVRYNYMYVKRNYKFNGYGLGNMGIQIFFPISPKHCIYIFDDIMYQSKVIDENKIVLSRGTYVDELNKLFYLNSYKYLFFNEKTKESYIRRLVENLKHDNSLNKELVQFGSSSNKLIMQQVNYVKEYIKMPFLSINPKLINMPLPQHTAGPIRPYAQKFY
ncbi:MAG TPA: DUF4238 domain-containing protein [Thermoanaerobacterales bacterium]|nr:DUF4238 domain-containing protein [Thermoanaerobacterales bacterium]